MKTALYWEPGLRLEHDTAVDPARILEALAQPGAIVKRSRRTIVRRVGDWAIKEAKARHPLQWADLSMRAERYTKAWTVGRRLREAGITVPAPIAVVSRQRYGVCRFRATVSEWLEGWHDVEEAARRLHGADADPAAVRRFLEGIAALYTRLTSAGFRHADLSGKNIFCKAEGDGFEFALIDLDSAEAVPITPEQRFRNAVQLHDSFCDLWDDEALAPLVLPVMNASPGDWETLQRVCAGQQARRARIEAIWARQGGGHGRNGGA